MLLTCYNYSINNQKLSNSFTRIQYKTTINIFCVRWQGDERGRKEKEWLIFTCIFTHTWCGPQSAGSVCCSCNKQIHMDYRSPVEKKGRHGHSLSEREGERARTPAWTGFYCVSGYITLRMVLIYCAQVCCRWLPFTDNKQKNVANYFKEKDVADQGEKWLNCLYFILGRFSLDFRKLL